MAESQGRTGTIKLKLNLFEKHVRAIYVVLEACMIKVVFTISKNIEYC